MICIVYARTPDAEIFVAFVIVNTGITCFYITVCCLIPFMSLGHTVKRYS